MQAQQIQVNDQKNITVLSLKKIDFLLPTILTKHMIIGGMSELVLVLCLSWQAGGGSVDSLALRPSLARGAEVGRGWSAV